MMTLKRYIDDLWMSDVRSFKDLTPTQCTVLMGYIIRDYYQNEISDFMAYYDPKDLINYFLAQDLGNPDYFDWVELNNNMQKKFLEGLNSHLCKSLKDTIDMLFEEKEEEMADIAPELDPDRFHDFPEYYRDAS